MKFEIWSEGDPKVGIASWGAKVEIDYLEDCDEDTIKYVTDNLHIAFETIFDDTRVYVVEVTETGVIDR